MDEMKKIRKGQGGNMDFLEPSSSGGKSAKEGKGAKEGKASGKVGGGRVEQKRNAKDKKFGFGGKKRDVKKNDKRSNDDVSSFRPGQKTRAGGNSKGPKGSKARPGKGNRQKMKNHNKNKKKS
jgi:rRNA-processing protein EBP2